MVEVECMSRNRVYDVELSGLDYNPIEEIVELFNAIKAQSILLCEIRV